jgi:hypothetical protein
MREHADELHDLHYSKNIIWVIKEWEIRLAGHVARRARREVHIGFWCENLTERYNLEDLSVDGRIIFKWISKKWDGEDWDRCRDLEQGIGPSGSIKCGEFLKKLRSLKLLKDFAPWIWFASQLHL